MTTTFFNVFDWYWFVGGDDSRAYSSKRNVYVDPAADTDYLLWKQNNGFPAVPIESEDELSFYAKQVQPAWMFNGTTFVQPAPDQYTKPQLKNYNETVRLATVGAGIVAEGIPVATDIDSQQRITNARTAADADPQYTTVIIGTDGLLYPVDATQIIAVSDAFLAHATDIAGTSALVYANIDANIVTTLQEIDAAYASGVRRNIRDGRRNHYHRQ